MRKKRRPATPPAEPTETQRQAADLAAFRRMLTVAQGSFSLSFAVCNDRRLRESLVKQFEAEFPGLLIVRLPQAVEDVLKHVRMQMSASPPLAVFILDMEASIPAESSEQPALCVLNSSREQWEGLRCPVVFWLADYALTLLHAHAPDFWRYRSHQFEFVGEAVPLRDLSREPFPGYPQVDGLPYEEKMFRLAELERRLQEAGDPPSAEMLPHVLNWSLELAYLLRHFSRFQDAEKCCRKSLQWAENVYGPHHGQTAACLNDLALLLQATNHLEEAEPLMRRALAIDEARYGAEHPKVAIRLNNLAQLLQATNRLGEAEPLMRRALEIDEASFGSEHPKVAIRLNNLAQLLQDTNRLREAEPLMRRALEIDEASFGSEHPRVATQLNNLAQLLQATNRLGEAEPLMRRALAIDEASFGREHPDVAIRLNNLAQLLKATNRLGEAEPLMRRALGIFVRSLGGEHPNSQTVQRNYVALLEEMKLEEAEIEQRVRSAVAGMEATSPHESPKHRADRGRAGQ